MSRRRAASPSSDGDGDDAQAKDWKRYTALLSQNYAKLDPDKLSHPLQARDLTDHIKTLLTDSAVVAKEYRKCLDALNDAAGEMGECGAEELIGRADQEVREVIGLQAEGEARRKALERLRERANGGEELADVGDMYEQEVARRMDEWRKTSARKRFGTDKAYKEFRERVWEGKGEQGAMPPLKSFLPQEEGAEGADSSSDDDLEVAATARADYKCPLCIGVLKAPVRSLVCIHRYCHACFSEYLAQSGHPTVACPIAGCDKYLAKKDVERDVAFERRVQMYLRQEQNRGQEDDEEDGEEEGEEREEAVGGDIKPGAKRKMAQATQRGTQRRRAVVVADSSSEDE